MVNAAHCESVKIRFAFRSLPVVMTRSVLKRRNANMVLVIHPARINVRLGLNVCTEFARNHVIVCLDKNAPKMAVLLSILS